MGSTTEVSPQFDRDKGAENGQTVIVIHIEIVIVENLLEARRLSSEFDSLANHSIDNHKDT